MRSCAKPRQEAGLPPLGSGNCPDAELGLEEGAREGRTEPGRVNREREVGQGRGTWLRCPRGSNWDGQEMQQMGQAGEVASSYQVDWVEMERVKRAGKWHCSLCLLNLISPPRPGRGPRVSDRSQHSAASKAVQQSPRAAPQCHSL